MRVNIPPLAWNVSACSEQQEMVKVIVLSHRYKVIVITYDVFQPHSVTYLE